MTVTDSRRTGTSVYDTSRAKRTTGWRRRADTPTNLRGGLGEGGGDARRRRHQHHGDGTGNPIVFQPSKMVLGWRWWHSPKVRASGKRCRRDRGRAHPRTGQVWGFFGGLGFLLPPQSPSAGVCRPKRLPRHANQACSSQKNMERGKKKKKTNKKEKRKRKRDVPGKKMELREAKGAVGPAGGWDGREGWRERRQPGRRGRRREARGGTQRVEPGSCQPDFICISCLRPWGGRLAKPAFFQDIPPKENRSALFWSRNASS